MTGFGRGCVKTRNYGDVQKISLPGCAVLHSLEVFGALGVPSTRSGQALAIRVGFDLIPPLIFLAAWRPI
jgi:hypothetical protein